MIRFSPTRAGGELAKFFSKYTQVLICLPTYRSESAIIVLDDLHRLVEFVQVGPQLQISHQLLHTINTLLTTTPPVASKLLVVSTMTLPDADALDEPAALNLPDLFLQHQFVPLLDAQGVMTFINSRNIHRFAIQCTYTQVCTNLVCAY